MAEDFMKIAEVDFDSVDEDELSFEHEAAINDELDSYELVKFPDGWYLCMECE